MRKIVIFLIYILFIISVTSFSAVTSVNSNDSVDPTDDDENYNPTQIVVIKVNTDIDYATGEVEIVSQTWGYTTSVQPLTRISSKFYTYNWTTAGCSQAYDYKVKLKFEGVFVEDALTIIIDSSAPNCQYIKLTNPLNNQNIVKNGQTVTVEAKILDLSFGDTSNISQANIKADLSDFGGGIAVACDSYNAISGIALWAPFTVTGMSGDGTINITQTKDKASNNVTGITTKVITYDATPPILTSKKLINSAGLIDFTKSYENVKFVIALSEPNMQAGDITADFSSLGGGALVSPNFYDNSYATWEVYVNVTGNEEKTINFLATDDAGNSIGPINHNIILDTVKPQISNLIIKNSLGNSDYVRDGENITIEADVVETNSDINLIKANLQQLGGGISVSPDTLISGKLTWNLTTDLSLINDGVKTVNILASSMDKAGNLIEAASGHSLSTTIISDKTPPQANSIKLVNSYNNENNAKSGDNVKIVVDISDNNGLIASDIILDLSEITGVVEDTVITTYSSGIGTVENIIVGDITEGNKTISIKNSTVDKAGNIVIGTTTKIVRVDKTAPEVKSLIAKGSNQTLNLAMADDIVKIFADISDEDNIDISDIILNASSLGLANNIIPIEYTNNQGATWEITISSIATSGDYPLIISGIDKAGNPLYGTLEVVLKVDINSPEVTLVKLTNPSNIETAYKNGDTIKATVEISDIEGNLDISDITADITDFTGAGNEAIAPNSFNGNQAVWNITVTEPPLEGVKTFSLNATVKDKAGNIVNGTLEDTIKEDNTASDLSSVALIDGSYTKPGTIEISVHITESDSLASREVTLNYKVDGGALQTKIMSLENSISPYNYLSEVNITGTSFIYWITAKDNAGNNIASSLTPSGITEITGISVSLDNGAPVFDSTGITRAVDNAQGDLYVKVGDKIKVLVNASDLITASADLIVKADLSVFDTQFTEEIIPYIAGDTFEIITDLLSETTMVEGERKLIISIEDEVGNISTKEVSITLDCTLPVTSTKNIYSKGDRDIYFKQGDTGEIVFDMGETGLNITGEISTFDPAFADSAFTDNLDSTYTLSFTALTATMVEGTIEININIADKSGNSIVDTITGVLDKTAVDFALGTIEVTDSNNWYKVGDKINIRVILPKEERLTSLYCDLTPLGGNFSAQSEVPFVLSFYSDTGAVFTLTTDTLGSSINELIAQNISIKAVDKAGNIQTDSSLIINTDKTLSIVNTLVEFRDTFNNLLKSAETSFPVQIDDLYYESIDELHSNISSITIEVDITEANCEADLSSFALRTVVPGKGENSLNIKNAVDTGKALINKVGNIYTVSFTNIDVIVAGMEHGDSFEIYINGYDSAENTINTQIISSTLREYSLTSSGYTASVNPPNINPQGRTMLEFLVSGIELKAYNNGFDSVKIIYPTDKYTGAYINNASIEIANPFYNLDIVENPPVGGQCNASINGNEILFYFPQDIQEYFGEGFLNTAFKIKIEVEPLKSDNEPSYFTLKVLNSTLGREQTISDSLQVYINSPISSVKSEIWPGSVVPGGWVDFQVFIKPGISVQDTGYDRIIINHFLGDGAFETGTYTANILDNGDSFEIYSGLDKLLIDDDKDGNPESNSEVAVLKEAGRDTFEIVFFENKKTDEIIKLKYKVKAPTALLAQGRIEVTLKDSTSGLSVTDVTGGDAITEFTNNDLNFLTRNIAELVKAEVNPGRFLINDNAVMDITVEANLTTQNSGINYFYLKVPNFNFVNTSEISNVILKVSTFTMTTVTNKIPGPSEVLMFINDNNGTAEIELISGRKLVSSSVDKHAYIKLNGNIGSEKSDKTVLVKVGDDVNYSKITSLSANSDGVLNNDSLNYRTGNIYNGFTNVYIAPDKISSGGSSQFTLKINPDFQNAMKNLDANIFLIEFPLQLFNMSDPLSIRNSISVERELYNGGTPSFTSYSEIYSGTPSINEALVNVVGNTVEVRIGDLLHKKISPDIEGTIEIKLSLKALDINETSADIKVFAKNSSDDKKIQVLGGVTGNRTITVKRANMNAVGKVEDPDRSILGPVYIEKSKLGQRIKYISNITVQAISEPMNVLYFDFPDNFTNIDSSSVSQVTLQTVGVPIDITTNCLITDNGEHDISIIMDTYQINSGSAGTVEVIFTIDNPDVNNYPTGSNISCYIDNKDFSLPVFCENESFNSTKVFITETAQAIGGEINPAYTMTDTNENVVITIVPTINPGQFGVDSFEIRLPQGINYSSNFIVSVNNIKRIETTHFEKSVYDIDLGANGTKEVITVGFFNKLSNMDKLQISFTSYSNKKVYAIQNPIEIKAISTELGFSDILVQSTDVDGENNNNTLNYYSEGKPASITGITLVPDEMVVNEKIACSMNFSFDIDNIIHEGINKIVIDLPLGMTPAEIANTSVLIDGIAAIHTSINQLNDIVIVLNTIYNTNGSHNIQIDFKVNTPSNSMLAYMSLYLVNNNSHFNEILSDNLRNSQCSINIRKEVKNIEGAVLPNNAVASRNTDFSVFLRPEIETGDLGINRVLVNFPDGFTHIPGSEIKMWKISSGTPEIMSIETPQHSLFIPGYGDTGKTYDVAITTLPDVSTLKSPTFEVSVTDIYKIDIKLKAPVLAIGQEFINGSFEVFADNIYSPKEIVVKTSNSMPEWAGNSFNVRVSETKIKDNSLLLKLSSGSLGNYRLEMSCQFTSVMNNSIIPFVEIVSGQNRIQLKKIDYSGNRYTGYCLIPVADISDFSTVVDIEFDTNTFKDIYNTPLSQPKVEDIQVNPAFLISDFQYPLSKTKMLILIKTSENMKNDISLKITQENSLPKNIELSKIDNTLYKGVYVVDPTRTGQAYIEVTGTENNGNLIGKDIKIFNVIRGGLAPAKIEFSEFSIFSKTPVLNEDSVIISEFYNEDKNIIRKAPSENSIIDIEYLNSGINIWPQKQFTNPLKVEILNKKGAVIFREENGVFKFYSKLDKGINKSGKYVIAYDNKAPLIQKNSYSSYILNDMETGIDTITFKVDGFVKNVNINGSEQYTLDIEKELSFTSIKEYEIDIEVKDRAGNKSPMSIKYVPTSIGNIKVVTYPNPANDFVIFKADGLLTASKAILKIYDVSGKIIYRQNISGSTEFYWDITDKTGKKVANGLYYYKLETENYSFEGKIAVIK